MLTYYTGTARRFLEKFGAGLDQVIFCVNSDVDLVLYRELLPQYFPRSKQEEFDAISKLPADTGTCGVDQRYINMRDPA